MTKALQLLFELFKKQVFARLSSLFQCEAWPLAGDSFELFVPSTERGLSFILFVRLFVLCIVQKVERRRVPPFDGVLRLRIFNALRFFVSMRVEGVVELILTSPP